MDGKSVSLTGGLDPSYAKIRSVDPVGRFVKRPGEIVLDEPVAKDLLKAEPKNALGKTLKIEGKSYEVVGVVKAKKPAFGLPIHQTSYVITDDALALSGAKKVGRIVVEARDTGSVSEAAEEIGAALKTAHGTEDFRIMTQEDSLSAFDQITDFPTNSSL